MASSLDEIRQALAALPDRVKEALAEREDDAPRERPEYDRLAWAAVAAAPPQSPFAGPAGTKLALAAAAAPQNQTAPAAPDYARLAQAAAKAPERPALPLPSPETVARVAPPPAPPLMPQAVPRRAEPPESPPAPPQPFPRADAALGPLSSSAAAAASGRPLDGGPDLARLARAAVAAPAPQSPFSGVRADDGGGRGRPDLMTLARREGPASAGSVPAGGGRDAAALGQLVEAGRRAVEHLAEIVRLLQDRSVGPSSRVTLDRPSGQAPPPEYTAASPSIDLDGLFRPGKVADATGHPSRFTEYRRVEH